MYVLGIDIGTTGTKSAVIDLQGNVKGKGYKDYRLFTSEGGIVEQNANDWWDAVVESVRIATCSISDKSAIKALALSTQGASMVPVDSNFEPMCNALTWMDSRASAEAFFLGEYIGRDYLYTVSGLEASSALDSAKILWLKNNRQDIFSKARSFVSTIEFVNFKLTGRSVSDPTNSSMRQLIDIRKRRYDKVILESIGVEEGRLAEIAKTGEYIGNLTDIAAGLLGLDKMVHVYNGAHDQYCAALGCGATEAGMSFLSTGTAWVLLSVTDKLVYTSNHVTPGIHPVDGLYEVMTSLGNIGRSLQWMRDNLSSDDYNHINQEADNRRDSAKSLYAFPFFNGAGFPHNNNKIHAAIFGLELRHDRYDIARAIMEGVVFETKTALTDLKTHGCNVDRLRIMGGASKSRVWSGIIAAVTGCQTSCMKEPEACCMGAAIIAAVGSGAYHNYQEAVSQMVKTESIDKVDLETLQFYIQKYEEYQQLFRLIEKYTKERY